MPDNPTASPSWLDRLSLPARWDAQPDDLDGVPVLVADRGPVTSLIRLSRTEIRIFDGGIGRPADITLIPYFTVHGQYTSVYWDLMSESRVDGAEGCKCHERTRRAVIDARTVDNAGIGDTLPERDHNLKGKRRGLAMPWAGSTDTPPAAAGSHST